MASFLAHLVVTFASVSVSVHLFSCLFARLVEQILTTFSEGWRIVQEKQLDFGNFSHDFFSFPVTLLQLYLLKHICEH